jgi:hypothetical protein
MAEGELSSRRRVLGWTARLAMAAPALMAGLQLAGATAHADDDDDDDEGDDRRGRNRGRGRGARVEVDDARRGNTTFSADLVPINEVNASDFNPGGSDSGFGSLSVGSAGSSSSVFVRLRGATPNLTYNVQFVPLSNSGARQQLGSLTTNSAGNASVDLAGVLAQSGSAPDQLGTRVGAFVLTRNDNGNVAFITAA